MLDELAISTPTAELQFRVAMGLTDCLDPQAATEMSQALVPFALE
jgi:hypothetical protein